VHLEKTGKGKDLKRVLFYNFLPGESDPELDRQERRWPQNLDTHRRRASIFGSYLERGGVSRVRSEW
jgi:hypothetical protein